jgi:hypothetical protein
VEFRNLAVAADLQLAGLHTRTLPVIRRPGRPPRIENMIDLHEFPMSGTTVIDAGFAKVTLPETAEQ